MDIPPLHPEDRAFCCWRLRNAVRDAGRRGAGILVERLEDELHLVLQSRGVDVADQTKLVALPIPAIVNIATDVGIRYCPWCGRELADLIAHAPQVHAELARQHETLRAHAPRRG